MQIVKFILLLIAVWSTFYVVNYRVVITIKLLINKEWLQMLDLQDDSEKTQKSASKIEGFYGELDKLENRCFLASLCMVISWTIILFMLWF